MWQKCGLQGKIIHIVKVNTIKFLFGWLVVFLECPDLQFIFSLLKVGWYQMLKVRENSWANGGTSFDVAAFLSQSKFLWQEASVFCWLEKYSLGTHWLFRRVYLKKGPRRNKCKLAVRKIRFDKDYRGKKHYLCSHKEISMTVIHPEGAALLMRKEVVLPGHHPGHSYFNLISLFLKRMSSVGGFHTVLHFTSIALSDDTPISWMMSVHQQRQVHDCS